MRATIPRAQFQNLQNSAEHCPHQFCFYNPQSRSSSPTETQLRHEKPKQMEAAQRRESKTMESVSCPRHEPPPPSAFLPGLNYKGLIWQGCCGSRKNPDMASESSRKDDRISEVKTTPVTFSSNPLNWQVGERRCRKGMGNAPKCSQLTVK